MKDIFGSQISPHVSHLYSALAALAIDFLSPGGLTATHPANLCRTLDRVHAQSTMIVIT